MDRGQRPACLLTIAALLLLTGAAASRQLPIREARWLQSPDVVADLTQQPPECLAWPSELQQQTSVAIGRALFRSPLMLGGQAARAGLSCASCHRNGRANAHFHFPGISGAPGTADVTASLMSEKRGDDIFNPKPIPDLGGDPKTLKVKGTPKLDDFIHGLIVEEFSGPEPSAAALEALVAYVNALSPEACKSGRVWITLGAKLADIDTAVTLAAQAYREGDPATGRDLLAAARSNLGAIDERFQLIGMENARSELRKADAQLFRLEEGQIAWVDWRRDWPRRKRVLRSMEGQSLFNPALLRQQLAKP